MGGKSIRSAPVLLLWVASIPPFEGMSQRKHSNSPILTGNTLTSGWWTCWDLRRRIWVCLSLGPPPPKLVVFLLVPLHMHKERGSLKKDTPAYRAPVFGQEEGEMHLHPFFHAAWLLNKTKLVSPSCTALGTVGTHNLYLLRCSAKLANGCKTRLSVRLCGVSLVIRYPKWRSRTWPNTQIPNRLGILVVQIWLSRSQTCHGKLLVCGTTYDTRAAPKPESASWSNFWYHGYQGFPQRWSLFCS